MGLRSGRLTHRGVAFCFSVQLSRANEKQKSFPPRYLFWRREEHFIVCLNRSFGRLSRVRRVVKKEKDEEAAHLHSSFNLLE
jgi:hypothetical protein